MQDEHNTITLNRRNFLKASASVGALSIVNLGLSGCSTTAKTEESTTTALKGKPIEAIVDPNTGNLEINEDIFVRYSACLGCYSSCGNKVNIDKATGKILSVGGNPYNPNNAYPFLNHDTPLTEAYKAMSYTNGGQVIRGGLCARGNGTLDAYSQPDRITLPLKRAGKRGEGKWKPISWDQLIEELVEGGKLFADIGEDQEIEGFRALHDSTTPQDPNAPELGPISNQLVMFGGRGDGRPTATRFAKAFGTVNNFGHGSSCGGASIVSFGALEGHKSGGLYNDYTGAEYVISCGLCPGAGGKSMQGIAQWASSALSAGTLKLDVVDPALGNCVVTPSAKNAKWTPIKTATNDAFISALVRIIIENNLYNIDAISYPTQKTAEAGGYNAYTNASYLVIEDESHKNYKKLLRAEDIDLETPSDAEESTEIDYFVVVDNATGQPTLHTNCNYTNVKFEGEIGGIKVKTAFLKLSDSIFSHSVEEYSDRCKIPAEEIERMAREFTSHGTKASIGGFIGGTAQANGGTASMGYPLMNSLIGSNNMRGGTVPRRVSGSTHKDGPRYKLSTIAGQPKSSGASIARTGLSWEKTSEYASRSKTEENPTPKLPWFAKANSSDNQAISSVVNKYPYQAKIMLTWMATPLQASPGVMRETAIEQLKDPQIVPLAITCDVVMGESAHLSDYFVPDTTPYESWGTHTQEGFWNGKGNLARWQVSTPETIELSDGRHASYETLLCDISKKIGIPGFGDNALESVEGQQYAYNDASDYFLKAIANLAYSDDDPVPDITEEEMRMQGLDQLPETWKSAVSDEEWPKVLHVMSRGGRYWPIDNAFDELDRSNFAGEHMTYYYNEAKALAKNPYTGEYGSGVLTWQPETFADLTPIHDMYPEEEWPFASTNYKPKFRSISMLANSPIMQQISAENYFEINEQDAKELGIVTGEKIVIENPTGDIMQGPALVRAGVAKGTFALEYGYGHIAYGSQDMEIDGAAVPGNSAISTGIHLQTMLDPKVEGIYPLSDPESATPGRSGGVYKISKA